MVRAYRNNHYVLDNHIRPQHHFVGPKINSVYRYQTDLTPIAIKILKTVGLRPRNKNLLVNKKNTASEHHTGTDKIYNMGKIEATSEASEIIKKFYAPDFELHRESEIV